MGRVFVSPRIEIQRIARNWQQSGAQMREQDRIAADHLRELAKRTTRSKRQWSQH